MSQCPLCLLIDRVQLGDRSRVVREFPNSILVVGEHRFFPGYCVLVHRSHVRDLHLLASAESAAFADEMVQSTRAVAEAYGADKMNHASYGNLVPHLHWHLFPRRADEPEEDRYGVPWKHQLRFGEFPADEAYSAEVIRRVSAAFAD